MLARRNTPDMQAASSLRQCVGAQRRGRCGGSWNLGNETQRAHMKLPPLSVTVTVEDGVGVPATVSLYVPAP